MGSFSRADTPARSSELFPTPLSAYSRVSREARRFPMMRVRSASRPKKSPASVSRKQSRPTYGPSEAFTAPRARPRAGRACAPARPGTRSDAVAPRAPRSPPRARARRDRVGVHRHGPGALEPVAPDALEEHAPRPVLHPVAQEQEVALAHLVEDLDRDQALDRALRQVADVVVLGDDEVVAHGPPLAPEVRARRRGASR